MTAEEIADRVALLINPQPDMSGRQINRFHGVQRRRIEELAAAVTDERATMLSALKAMDAALTKGWLHPEDPAFDPEQAKSDGMWPEFYEAWKGLRAVLARVEAM